MWSRATKHVHMPFWLKNLQKVFIISLQISGQYRRVLDSSCCDLASFPAEKIQLWALVAQFKLFTPSVCMPTMTTHIDVSKAKNLKVMHLQSVFTSMDFLVDYWLVCHGTMPPRVASAWLHFLLARHIPWNYAKPWTMLCSSKRESTSSEGRRLLWCENSTPHLFLLDTFGKDYHQLTSPMLSSWRSDVTPFCKGKDESVCSYCNS